MSSANRERAMSLLRSLLHNRSDSSNVFARLFMKNRKMIACSSFPAFNWKRKQSAGRLLPPCKNTSVGWILVSGDAVEHAVVQFEHAVVQCLNVQ